MSPTFFTTDDGDIILRAGTESDPKYDFRVHKLILSLASPVFKDMFAVPQPPDQTLNEQHQIPVVDVPDPPEVLDTMLRFIYPGVELPKVASVSALGALFSVADKYNIASVYSFLKESLKTFLPAEPFAVYAAACRFGFMEVAREAAKTGNTRCIIYGNYDKEVQHVSSADLFRWMRFVQEREELGRRRIEAALEWWFMSDGADCDHEEGGRQFYFRLEKAVVDAFASNPCVGRKDLLDVLDTVPDPPLGCKPSPDSESADFYRGGGGEYVFNCPLQPMSIRNYLAEIAQDLDDVNRTMLDKAFGKVVWSG